MPQASREELLTSEVGQGRSQGRVEQLAPSDYQGANNVGGLPKGPDEAPTATSAATWIPKQLAKD